MLDKNSPTPLYVQVQDEIRNWIKTGQLKTDQRLPSTKKLTEQFGISPNPIRRALDELIKEGVIWGVQGKGTFVAEMVNEFDPIESFSQQTRYLNSETVVREKGLIDADKKTAEALMVPIGSELARIERLRYVDDKPFVLQTAYLPSELCPSILNQDLKRSLYQILLEEYGLRPVNFENRYTARLAESKEEQILKLEYPSPVVIVAMRQTSYLENGRPIEYVFSAYYPGDYEFYATHTPRFSVGRDNDIT